MMRPWAKILAIFILLLGTLELLWVIAANRYLQSQAFQALLQKRSMRITYENAFSALPGNIHLKGLTLEDAHTRLEIPEADLQFSLLALAGKRIIIWSAQVDGGSLMLQPEVPEKDAGGDSGRGSPPPASELKEREWPLHIRRLQVRNLKSLVIGGFAAQGSIDFAADLRLAGQNSIEIRQGGLQLHQVQTHWKDQKLAHIEAMQGSFQLAPFQRNDELLRKLSIDLNGKANLEQGAVLQNFIIDAPWLQIKGLNLQASGRLVLEEGRLTPPTDLVFESPHMKVDLWKETVGGLGRLHLAVAEKVRMELSIPAFQVDHESKGAVDVSGRDLSLKLFTENRDLLSHDRGWQAALDLPESTVHDLRYFNHFIPKGLGFAFRSGEGRLAVHLDSATTRGNFIRVEAPAAGVVYENQEFFGRIQQELNIATIDLVQEGFIVPTGELKIDLRPGGADSGSAPWIGRLQLKQGRMQLSPSRFEGLLQLQAADLRPLLWIFDPQSKLPDWSRKLFHKDSLEAQFHLKADESGYSMDQFKAGTDELKLEAWYQGQPPHKRGKLLLRYGPLSAGIGISDNNYKIQLLSSREWFHNRQ